MAEYTAPLRDIRLALQVAAGLPALVATGGFGDLNDELADAVLEGAGKFAREVLAPLNVIGDRQGVSLSNDKVKTADGFAAAYRAYRDPPRGSRAAVRAIAAADDAGRAYLAHRRTHGGDA